MPIADVQVGRGNGDGHAVVATQALADIERPPERVHVQYALAAAGRQAFGCKLVE